MGIDLLAVVVDGLAGDFLAGHADAACQLVLHSVGQVRDPNGRLFYQGGHANAQEIALNALVDAHGVAVWRQVVLAVDEEGDEDQGYGQHAGQDAADDARVAQQALAVCRGNAVVGHVDDQHGHVVGAAGREGRGHQVVGRLLGRCRRDGHALDLAVGNHAGQAVRAHDDAVAAIDVQREVIGVHVWVGAQRAGDDRARGVDAGLVGRDLARVHKLLDVGVVVRDAHQRAMAQQVDARIAHVGHGHFVLLD